MAEARLRDSVAEFAYFLRELTAALDAADGWYGVFTRRDPEGLRACLDGREVPPWDVVESLLHDLAGRRGAEAAAEAGARARQLHGAAVAAYDALTGGPAALRDRLDAMLGELAHATRREQELRAALREADPATDVTALNGELAWVADDVARAQARVRELERRIEDSGEATPPPTPPIDPFAPHAPSGEAVASYEPAGEVVTSYEPSGDAANPYGSAGEVVTPYEPAGAPFVPHAAAAEGSAPYETAAEASAPHSAAEGPAGYEPAAYDPMAYESAGEAVAPYDPAPDPFAPQGQEAVADPFAARGAGEAQHDAGGRNSAKGDPRPVAGSGRGPELRTSLPPQVRQAVTSAVAHLAELRAAGRGGEAHAVLCAAARRPAEELPHIADELERSGLAADVSTLLWEVACLPPGPLAAAAGALAAAGRVQDCVSLLRQGVARPVGEVGDAALALREAGRPAEARELLAAIVRARTAEEAAGAATATGATEALVPLLLEAAETVSEHRRRDVVHALRTAGVPDRLLGVR